MPVGHQQGVQILRRKDSRQPAQDARAEIQLQRQAAGFYAHLGWRETGPDFDEAGIPHVPMEKTL